MFSNIKVPFFFVILIVYTFLNKYKSTDIHSQFKPQLYEIHRVFKMRVPEEFSQYYVDKLRKPCSETNCEDIISNFVTASEYLNICYLLISSNFDANSLVRHPRNRVTKLINCEYFSTDRYFIRPMAITFLRPMQDADIIDDMLIFTRKLFSTTKFEDVKEIYQNRSRNIAELEKRVAQNTCEEKKSLGFINIGEKDRLRSFYITWNYCRIDSEYQQDLENSMQSLAMVVALKTYRLQDYTSQPIVNMRRIYMSRPHKLKELESWLVEDKICHENTKIEFIPRPNATSASSSSYSFEIDQVIEINLKTSAYHSYIEKIFHVSESQAKVPLFNHVTWIKFLYLSVRSIVSKISLRIFRNNAKIDDPYSEQDFEQSIWSQIGVWISSVEDSFLFSNIEKSRFEENGYLVYLSSVLRGLEQSYTLSLNNTTPNLYLHIKSIQMLSYPIDKHEKFIPRCLKENPKIHRQIQLQNLQNWSYNLTKKTCHDHGLTIVPCFTSTLINIQIDNNIELPTEADSILLPPNKELNLQIHYRPDLMKYSFERYLHIKTDVYHCQENDNLNACTLLKKDFYLKKTLIKVIAEDSLFTKILQYFEGPIRVQFKLWFLVFTMTVLGIIIVVLLSYIDSETMINLKLDQIYNHFVAYKQQHDRLSVIKKSSTKLPMDKSKEKLDDFFDLKKCRNEDITKSKDSNSNADPVKNNNTKGQNRKKPSVQLLESTHVLQGDKAVESKQNVKLQAKQDVSKKKRKKSKASSNKASSSNVNITSNAQQSGNAKALAKAAVLLPVFELDNHETSSSINDPPGIDDHSNSNLSESNNSVPDWFQETVDPSLFPLEKISELTGQGNFDSDCLETTILMKQQNCDITPQTTHKFIEEDEQEIEAVKKSEIYQLFDLIKMTSESYLDFPQTDNLESLYERVQTINNATNEIYLYLENKTSRNVRRRSNKIRPVAIVEEDESSSICNAWLEKAQVESQPDVLLTPMKNSVNQRYEYWAPASSAIWGHYDGISESRNLDFWQDQESFDRDDEKLARNYFSKFEKFEVEHKTPDEKWSFIRGFTSASHDFNHEPTEVNLFQESLRTYYSCDGKSQDDQVPKFHLPKDLFDSPGSKEN